MGWEGSLDAELTAGTEGQDEVGQAAAATVLAEAALPSEETIEDHYAALQAWTEWARNRGRASSPDAPSGISAPVQSPQEMMDDLASVEDESRLAAGLRAESQHEHAPYSQLFTTLRQSR